MLGHRVDRRVPHPNVDVEALLAAPERPGEHHVFKILCVADHGFGSLKSRALCAARRRLLQNARSMAGSTVA